MDATTAAQRIRLGEDSRTELKSTSRGLEAKLLLVVDVPASTPDRPYRAEHVFYIRDASMTREATREELLRLLQSQNVYHDESPVRGATLDDLDLEAVDGYLRSLYEPAAPARRDSYLRSLRCLDEDSVPTVAGILLFGRDPQRWIPDARLSAVRFAGTVVSSEFADRKEIGGTLLSQLDHASMFVPAPSSLSGLERVEQGIPQVVLREALVNALAHRDYRAASQIRLFVFDDRVEIINPGILLNHLTVESIRLGGISVRRNPVLAALLSRARRSESGRLAMPEMGRTMRERGLPEPEISTDGGHVRVVLRRRRRLRERGKHESEEVLDAPRDTPRGTCHG